MLMVEIGDLRMYTWSNSWILAVGDCVRAVCVVSQSWVEFKVLNW